MSGDTPSAVDVRALAAGHTLIPVHRDLLADTLTPVRAHALLSPPGEPGFLLESVEGGERLARYSFIGYRPAPLSMDDEGGPLSTLAQVAAERPARLPGPAALPSMFAGGPPRARREPGGNPCAGRWTRRHARP